MIEDRDALNRVLQRFPPRPGMVDRVYERLRRKQRNRRIGSAALALGLTAAVAGAAAAVLHHSSEPVTPVRVPNGRIVFVTPGQGVPEDRMFTVDADGTDPRRVIDRHVEYPRWSPNGQLIAFDDGTTVSIRDWPSTTGHVFVVRPDGTGVRRVVPGNGGEFAPSWSPDGSRLAILAYRQGAPGIFVADVASGSLTRVTSNPDQHVLDLDPAYSPDGERIAFARSRLVGRGGSSTDVAAVFVVGVDGSGLHRLTAWRAGTATPTWSPDGRSIVFQRGNLTSAPRSQLYVIGADGTGLRQLTSGPDAAAIWPSWSPDGQRVVFTRWVFAPKNAGFRLYTVNVDGTHLAPLTAPGRNEQNEADWGRHP